MATWATVRLPSMAFGREVSEASRGALTAPLLSVGEVWLGPQRVTKSLCRGLASHSSRMQPRLVLFSVLGGEQEHCLPAAQESCRHSCGTLITLSTFSASPAGIALWPPRRTRAFQRHHPESLSFPPLNSVTIHVNSLRCIYVLVCQAGILFSSFRYI